MRLRVREYDVYADAKCSLCGKRADAMWGGDTNVFVCSTCAVDTLPQLIADAIYKPRDKDLYTAAHQALPRILLAFWRAMTARSSHVGE